MMKPIKNILLVYPEIPKNTFWSFTYTFKFIRKKGAMPPLGLITVAALFPEKYHLKLVDMNIEPLPDSDIQNADMVFISAMIVQKESLRDVVGRCNRLGTPVVAGGAYPTSSPEEITGVDHLVQGEVEDNFLDILAEIEAGEGKEIYPCPDRPEIGTTILPRFDLLKMDAYGTMSVQYSRGCPFKCEFCDIWKVYGNKPRLKSSETVISELNRIYELGWRGAVFLVDDNFIGNKKQVKQSLLPALQTWQADHFHDFSFFTQASINMADDDDLLLGRQRSGFTEVFIGIETPSTASLKETGKTQNLKTDLKQAVRKIQTAGIEVMAGFIVGFDSDTEDIFDRQISFIQETGTPQAMVGLLAALPGTDLHQRLTDEGRILGGTMGNNTHNLTTNFKTKMRPAELRKGYLKVLSSIYDSNLKNYFSRCSRLMDNLENTAYFQRKIGFNEVRMFFKSLLRQPFTPYGYQYIKFITRNFIKNRPIWGEAIRFSIIGHHFHTITQETLKVDKVTSDLERSYRYLQEQVGQYSTAVLDHSMEVFQNIVELYDQRKETLDSIYRQIEKVHIDFRDDINQTYSDMSGKINALFLNFEEGLIKHGRAIKQI